MISQTPTIQPETSAAGYTPNSSERPMGLPYNASLTSALNLAAEVAARYDISDLSGLLASAQALAGGDEVSVAVLGRFKAGKSSFLNHFLGRELLPVGVVPVTAAVTVIRFGTHEEARVHHRDGRDHEVMLDRIGAYISERENPENAKEVSLITVELPELRRFRGLQFVDTPGLDSALSHNTEASLAWLPHAGLALVAVSVDPPLSQRDVDLLKSLYRYTPKVAILLTKADLLSEPDLQEVTEYVREQLARNFPGTPQIFTYSTKPGFERFRDALEAELAGGTLERYAEERESILLRKMDTLLRELNDYLALSLKSAEMQQSERQALNEQLLSEKEALDDVKSVIRLLVQDASNGARDNVAKRLEEYHADLEKKLLTAFASEFPKWTKSLAVMLRSFEEWLEEFLLAELTAISSRHHDSFMAPWRSARKQILRALQQFRDRLSDSTMRGFGVPLRTTETEIDIVEPGAPNIRVGRVFDRNWELLSPVVPVWTIESVVRRHFESTIAHVVEQNLSRLTTQWEESIKGPLASVEKEAKRRLDELMATVERLVGSGSKKRTPQLRADLERIEAALKSVAEETAG
ncbi:MAG: dynamin family protein [Bryobacteraceae bacterium]|jgi:GTP-binding protein EngB required for normal cell division